MSKLLSTVTLALGSTLVATSALAGTNTIDLPEPGMLGLFAGGAVAAILFARSRRK